MIRPRRAALSAASLITAALVALSGCTPDGGADKGGAASPTAQVSVSASATPSPSASPSDSPSATPSAAAPTSEAAEPPAPTRAAPPVPTRKPHKAGGDTGSGSGGSASGGSGSGSGSGASDGVILAPSGNHYRRGQFCKKAHLGLTTKDAHGATLSCEMQSGRPHWQ
ncbi:hypothetical protein ACH4FX_02515 [Streptomyces sp. NPDC018019]|uniref:hypothetical protein n=1 Tax=Streptomyces sp. NPDC018019 TaxID=3365030 RepID=UPI00378FC6F2